MLPTAHSIGTDIEIGGEEHLAGIESLPDVANFLRGKLPGPRRNACDAQVDGFPAFVGSGVVERLPHIMEDIHFVFFRHVQSLESLLT